MDLSHSLCEDFKKNTCFRLDEGMRMIAISLSFLNEKDLWEKPNEHLNSVGNLILHLCGNLTQYVISGLGGKTDERERDLEFQQTGIASKSELKDQLQSTVNEVKETILSVTPEDYLRQRQIQGFDMSGMGAVIHAVEHFSYHTGQIAFWVKLLRNTNLQFYDGIDLNTLNK